MANYSSVVRRLVVVGAAVVAVAAGLILGLHHQSSGAPAWTLPANFSAPADHAVGGEVRVAVSTPPESQDTGAGGAAVRSLVLPHLFVGQPDGSWTPSLVQPGSDGAARDGLTAWFKLRNAKWSNGAAITADDLRRTMDARFIKSVDNADANGRIVVHLKNKLPGWRWLWSGDAGISAPATGIYGGPFVVRSVVSGAETVLARNANWVQPSFLNDVKLEYVPDATTAEQLLAAGDVDVVAPVADTVRTARYQAIAGVKVSVTDKGGAWTALQFNSSDANATFANVLSAFPRRAFVGALLSGEASEVNGFASNDNTWTNYGSSTGVKLDNANVTLSVPTEDPLSPLLSASLQRAVTTAGGKLQVRSIDSSSLNALIKAKTYDVALVSETNQPSFCWTCTFGNVDSSLATKADTGNNAAALSLEARARNNGALLPLWREQTLVAYCNAVVGGVSANGYATSPLADAPNWHAP